MHKPTPFFMLAAAAALLPSASAFSQTAPKPPVNPPGKSARSTDELDRIVATVGRYKITFREVMLDFAARNEKLVESFRAENRLKSPASANVTLAAVGKSYLASNPDLMAGYIQDAMMLYALKEAAERRNLRVSEADVRALVHADLDLRRRAKQWPEGMSDDEIATRFGDSMVLLKKVALRTALTQRLVAADLSDQLGHAPQPDDFFSAHILSVEAIALPDKRGELDMASARKEIEALREQILTKKRGFEEIAREKNRDISKLRGGDLGPLPRTLLRADIEKALLALKPGEITPPLSSGKGYVILRLDKRGSELTELERRRAILACAGVTRRQEEMRARFLKDIPWTTTIGQPPEWYRQGPAPQ